MTHVLFYIGLSVMLFIAVLFVLLTKLHSEKKPMNDSFEIK